MFTRPGRCPIFRWPEQLRSSWVLATWGWTWWPSGCDSWVTLGRRWIFLVSLDGRWMDFWWDFWWDLTSLKIAGHLELFTDFRCLNKSQRVMCDVFQCSPVSCLRLHPGNWRQLLPCKADPFQAPGWFFWYLGSATFSPFQFISHFGRSFTISDGEFSSWNPSIFAYLPSRSPVFNHQPRPENIQMLPRIHIFQGTALSEQDLSGDSGSVSGASYPVVQMIPSGNWT